MSCLEPLRLDYIEAVTESGRVSGGRRFQGLCEFQPPLFVISNILVKNVNIFFQKVKLQLTPSSLSRIVLFNIFQEICKFSWYRFFFRSGHADGCVVIMKNSLDSV
jgi:hypothetical protein